MSREIRRVPLTWEHPCDALGHYIPMTIAFPYNADEIAEGLRDGWLTGGPPNYGLDVMPQWWHGEATAWQLYETTSEGTPLSPVCATAEDLVIWLMKPQAIGVGGAPVAMTREGAEKFVEVGWSPTMIGVGGRLMSGLEWTESKLRVADGNR